MTSDPEQPDYNLEYLRVLHFAHPLQNDPEDASAAVTLGFEWAEAGEGQGLFLCRDSAPCADPEHCGRTFWEDAGNAAWLGQGAGGGHEAELTMPWTAKGSDGSGELEVFHLWCCSNCELQGTGAVFDVWVGRFYDLPARLLMYIHETRSHTYGGLRKSMGEMYPDDFNEASFVTLMLYRRTL